jgi:hypothetical protein
MRRLLMMVVLAAVFVIVGSACSARGQYFEQVTRENGAHFATWHHMGYSVNRATPGDTTNQDVARAGEEKWFGEVVRVQPIL